MKKLKGEDQAASSDHMDQCVDTVDCRVFPMMCFDVRGWELRGASITCPTSSVVELEAKDEVALPSSGIKS